MEKFLSFAILLDGKVNILEAVAECLKFNGILHGMGYGGFNLNHISTSVWRHLLFVLKPCPAFLPEYDFV